MNKKKNPIIFTILDGWGVGPKDKGINAIEAARTPFFDDTVANCPYTQLSATGIDVGLEKNQMSGSESGHLNIGAGRIVEQDVRIILEAIGNESFFKNSAFLGAVRHMRHYNSNIHLMGLLGNEDSPHAHPDILLALLIFLKRHGLSKRVFLHFFTDGRDSYPKSALEHWKLWKELLNDKKIAKCATVCGRFYAMDRVKNWDRLLKAYNAMVNGEGERYAQFEDVVKANYKKGKFDEYIEPSILTENGKPVAAITDNDAIIFFNFRSDRARQISKLFVGTNTKKEKGFPKIPKLKNLFFVAMTNFGPDLNLETAFRSNPLAGTLPVALSSLRQLYIAETEKFAHVTYFINGGYADAVGREDRIMVRSPIVRSYAEKPEMSAGDITDVIIKSIRHDIYDAIVVNYANTDMVGHTGNFKAVVQAVECVDKQLIRLSKALKNKDGTLVISADHGNADIMIDKQTQKVFTFHTKNPVPFVIISSRKEMKKKKLQSGGVLGNIAPTILDLLDLPKPKEMNKESLIN
ncbi:MAG: 2,3-bisphosphoglycerate-independent phosphoglycerate mutase [Patescibacteria group bacterium]|nr:2,3-bisphosphoglycerate-independent phosphoglycerate mutase [Patescibacteria group bacterium]